MTYPETKELKIGYEIGRASGIASFAAFAP